MKNLVYETPVETAEDLVARVVVTAGEIADTPGVIELVYQNIIRRYNACNELSWFPVCLEIARSSAHLPYVKLWMSALVTPTPPVAAAPSAVNMLDNRIYNEDWLNDVVTDRWFGRHAPDNRAYLQWPPRSPDLTPCDFFPLGFVKDQVYVPPLPANLPELRDRIRVAVAAIPPVMLIKTQKQNSDDERVMERRKFSPAPGFEPGLSALRADADAGVESGVA
ncbi:hypothetical protein ANN_20909 [Periplaneta americana]|uniref:Uncharacterized protein n=1 Tax=Periplaneta americana TaxID=6978 RepID=A0ABQ8SF27_PERAM|nr:hypothetical protein ANN_20909 [Periplaneta americana]